MKKVKGRIRKLAALLSASLLLSAVPPGISVQAETSEKEFLEGNILVRNEENGHEDHYLAYLDTKEEKIFLNPETLAYISGYEQDNVYDDEAKRFVRKQGTVDLYVQFYPDGTVETAWKDYRVPVREKNGEYYYSLAEALYLFGTQWAVTDKAGVEYVPPKEQNEDKKEEEKKEELCLQVFPRQRNILDYFAAHVYELQANRAGMEDMVTNGEWEWVYHLNTSVAAVFNDFDARILIPFWGANEIIEDRYEDALLLVAKEEMAAENEDVLSKAAAVIADAGFEGIKTGWSYADGAVKVTAPAVKLGAENPEAFIDAADKIFEEVSKKIPSVRFQKTNNISKLDPKMVKAFSQNAEELGKAAGNISNILSVADAAVQVHETGTRSKNWGEDYVRQMERMGDIDKNRYKPLGKKVKKAADLVVANYQMPTLAAVQEASDQAIKLLAGIAADSTPVGLLAGVLTGGIAVAKLNPSVQSSMDAADRAYTVKCLLEAETIAGMEMARYYSELLTDVQLRADITQEQIQNLRDMGILVLRANQKIWESMYDIHLTAENDPNWKNSEQAKEIKDNIAWDIAMETMLMNTEPYDEALFPADMEELYSKEFGSQRSQIPKELWNDKRTVQNNGGNVVEYKGNRYYWKYNQNSFYPKGLFAYYTYEMEAENQLVCRDSEGNEKVLMTGKGNGPVFISGERIYLQENGVHLFSVKLDGTERIDHGNIKLWAANETAGTLIGESGGAVCLLDADHTVKTVAETGGNFLGAIGGYCYYGAPQNDSGNSFTLYQISLDGSEVTVLDSVTVQEEWAMGLNACQLMQAGNTLYYSYGYYAGTGGFFQDGGINCVDIDGNNRQVCVAYGMLGAEEFLAEEKNGGTSIYYIGKNDTTGSYIGFWYDYPYDNCRVKTRRQGENQWQETQTKLSVIRPGAYICSGGEIMRLNVESMEYQTLIPSAAGFQFIDKPTGNEEQLALISQLDVVGEDVFFTVEWSIKNGEDMGWRPGYTRQRSTFYTMKIGDKQAKELYSY